MTRFGGDEFVILLKNISSDDAKRRISEIKKERSESCDNNYIEAIFRVAFFGCFGLDENALNNMLKDINYKEDLAYINKIHKNSIRNIRNYIIKANKY